MGWAFAASGWEFRSTDPATPRAWIQVSPDRSRHVVVENHGEHHMGAESVVIVPDRAVAGVSRFHTTNGQARFDPNGRWLIIEGVVGFVAVRLDDGSVAHYQDPDGAFIGAWTISGGVLEWKQSRTSSSHTESRSVPLDEIRARWQPGLGPFADGSFQPDVKFVATWDRWAATGKRESAMLPLPAFDRAEDGAFTVQGNRSAGLLALAVVVTIAVVAGLVVGALSRGGVGSDMQTLFIALIALIGLAPGLAVAESLVRHPRWVHFGTDAVVVRQVIGERRRSVRQITEIKSIQYEGSSFRFPVHVMVIFFSDAKPIRLDSDMIARSHVRDVATMERLELRVRQLYGRPGTWKVVDRRYPELVELTKQAR